MDFKGKSHPAGMKLTPQQMPWLGFAEVSIVQGPRKILSGHFVWVWSPVLNWDGLGETGQQRAAERAGEPERARVLSLMEHGAAEIESFSTNMGEERREGGELPGLRDRAGTGTNTS